MYPEPKYEFYPGGLPFLRDSKQGQHLVYSMLRRPDGVYVLNFSSLLVIDFDTPSARHVASDAVVGAGLPELQQALSRADAVFERYGFPGGATWRIHKTAGGYHAFRMDLAIPPSKEVADMLLDITCDPGYASLVRNTLTWPIRVSKKSPNEAKVFSVVQEATGPSPICEECRLQIWLYEQMVEKYGS